MSDARQGFVTGRLLLNDPTKAWLLVQGTADLFLVDLEGVEPRSSLDYIGTLDGDSLLFGLGSIISGSIATTIVAQGSPSARFLALGVEHRSGSDRHISKEVNPERLDQWILTMSQFCNAGLAPTSNQPVRPSMVIETAETTVLIGHREVSWIGGARETLRLYGAETHPASALPVPVCRHLWAQAAGGETLSIGSTAEWLGGLETSTLLSSGLIALHQAVLAQRVERRTSSTTQEHARFQRKVELDSNIFDAAIRKLVSPLEPAIAVAHTLNPGPLAGALQACQFVGSVMGIKIAAPEVDVPGESAMQTVTRIAAASGVRHRQILLRGEWWRTDQGPMIGFLMNDSSPVALLPEGTAKYRMLIPGMSERPIVTENVASTLDPRAYVFYRPLPAGKLNAKDILLFGLRNGKKDLITMLSVSVVTGLLSMAMPIATGVVFDEIIPSGQRNNLLQVAILLVSIQITIFLMGLGQSFATQRLEGRMESEMAAAIWDRLLNLRTRFFRQYTTGDLAARSLAINQIRQVLTGTVVAALLASIFSMFNFALLFLYSLKLALLAAALATVGITFSAVVTWISIRLQRKSMAMEGKIAGRVAELLQGVAKFRVSGTEPRAFARWAHDYAWQRKTMITAAKVSMAATIFSRLFPIVTSICIFIAAASLIHKNSQFSTGNFLAFNAAFAQFITSALAFSTAILSALSIVPSYERVKPILEELPELTSHLRKPGPLLGEIEFSHVCFSYHEDGPSVLEDISFTIKAGQYVAFVGESGSGKSTLVRLLLGFEVPSSGYIAYDSYDLADLDRQTLRRQIGVVLQGGKLLAGDIFTNIIGGSPLSMDDAWTAAMRVGLDEDIHAMPMGMHTVINDSGGGLSGGQRQRIMIARAIVNRPRILFFDEATSALDNKTQSVVSKNLEEMQATRIVIAHRLSTILHADLIMVLKAGKLHEVGTYQELLAKDGYFSELAKRQLA